jgi:hypothetical protein
MIRPNKIECLFTYQVLAGNHIFLLKAIVMLRPTYFVFHHVERCRSHDSFGHHRLQKDKTRCFFSKKNPLCRGGADVFLCGSLSSIGLHFNLS